MARIYADEHFPRIVSEFLRTAGHDMLTVQEAGNANQGIPDPEVLEFAASNDRAVLTLNRFDFIGLHKQQPNHAGIIVCKDDRDRNRLAVRINDAIAGEETLRGKLIRVNRPQ
jgi:predicted nuclease of predicted toxin-antitoxin system